MRRALAILGSVLTVLGLSGLRDDIASWSRFLSWLRSPELDWLFAGIGRTAFVLVGLALLVFALRPRRDGGRPSRTLDVQALGRALPPSRGATERVYLTVTPAQLVEPYARETSLQAAKLTAIYKDKWLRLRGRLHDVDEIGLGRLTVALEFDDDASVPPSLGLWFDASSWRDRIAVIPRGTLVDVAGRVKEITRYSVLLDDCELEPLTQASEPTIPNRGGRRAGRRRRRRD